MEAMAKTAAVLTTGVNKVTHSLEGMLAVAGLGAVGFGLENILRTTNEYFETIKRIHNATGLTVEQTDSIVDAFDTLAGMSGHEVERVMLVLNKNTTKAQQAMNGMGGNLQNIQRQLQATGVDIRKGPVKAIEDMARAAQKGKLNAGTLQSMFQIRPQLAASFIEGLKKGPEEVKKAMEEALKAGVAISAQNMRDFREYQMAQREVNSAWERIKITLGKEFYPILTKLLGEIKEKASVWVEYARDFGRALRFALTEGITLALSLTKILVANAALQRLTNAGIAGNIGKLGRWAFRGNALARGEAVADAMAAQTRTGIRPTALPYILYGRSTIPRQAGGKFMAAREAQAAFEAARVGAGGVNMGAGFSARGLAVAFNQFFEGSSLLWKAASGLAKLGVVFTLVTSVITGISKLFKSPEALETFIIEPFDKLVAALDPVLQPFYYVFGENGPLGPNSVLWEVFEVIIPMAVAGLMEGFRYVIQAVRTIVSFFSQIFAHIAEAIDAIRHGQYSYAKEVLKTPFLYNPSAQAILLKRTWKAIGDEIDAQAAARAAARRNRKLTPDEVAKTVFDFRNSRFDITQNFAEGFDPDRIAVAFTEDLAQIGNRRVMSALAPQFGLP